ncbi:uncharacterized protein PHACADRAFT_260186 [Phanerochaete carnosa HHB-10118-sp]|uniref:Uncharacterized protein n=1 Tax=Phanerochaete carnosa (strain HHB-10118-sp) TaxID=650164 RepID=K5W3J1_PHACS|nr:uncharacterized protein PHACADRAFT_260186 [Phanerochaete carnosa HHB-10118-sp]EKM53700.1 hypothetical protein PHACADRAFT_260186 [Phanerochaete carnosa HHB-10118-sp]
MSTASPTAYLLWAILSVLFLGFLIYHIWSYDKFRCLHWSSGRQPGAFKRIMTYSYLGSVPLFVIYSIATTAIKFREGWVVLPNGSVIPKPLDLYAPVNHHWILPLGFVFSFAWGLELITHLEELAFWLYLLHQNPDKAEWFESWEYRMWYMGSMVAFIGMPLTALVARRDVVTLDAYIFLAGSSGSTGTTVLFLYVLWAFPKFLKHVKAEGADPTVVVRLATFYALNLARVVFRFLFTIPLLIVAIDGIVGDSHPINRSVFWTDFLLMMAGIGCFVSTTITLLIFFPRSVISEAGYKPKLPTSVGSGSPKSMPPSPTSAVNRSLNFSNFGHLSSDFSPVDSRHQFYPTESQLREHEELDENYGYEDDDAPPYASNEGHVSQDQAQVETSGTLYRLQHAYPDQAAYQRQPFPHSLSSPYIPAAGALSPPPPPSPEAYHLAGAAPAPPSSTPPPAPGRVPMKRHSRRRSNLNQPASQAEMQRHSLGHVHRFGDGHPQVHGALGFSLPDDGRSTPSLVKKSSGVLEQTFEVPMPMAAATTSRRPGRDSHKRQSSSLHPYVMTFTSPIDLADLNAAETREQSRTMP